VHVPVMMSLARVCSSKSPKPFVSDVKMAEHSSLDIIPGGCRIKEVTSAASLRIPQNLVEIVSLPSLYTVDHSLSIKPLACYANSAIRSYLYHHHLLPPAQTHIRNTWLPGTQTFKKTSSCFQLQSKQLPPHLHPLSTRAP
jgi:hypothetical protein